ncbi:hypothetical protein O181_035537 [Austropuccinia psidii MF-1]|uniref:Uncharacterized protein n=1 Tax=Austropuccinia psidii MF-1 TaxID=1389203 RepID=A0A9Q3H932_9BASI|nr:hypothetical protein [Austropuccinia psidii MF-1]
MYPGCDNNHATQPAPEVTHNFPKDNCSSKVISMNFTESLPTLATIILAKHALGTTCSTGLCRNKAKGNTLDLPVPGVELKSKCCLLSNSPTISASPPPFLYSTVCIYPTDFQA